MENIEYSPATELVQNYYYDYAKFINLGGRTVPFYKDTLKAVQRRLLYASYLLTKNGSYVKSARIVGETMGKFHPHGNLSLDSTLVTTVHSGFLEGRGNFGSNVGVDPIDAAASRYTEVRLNPLIKEIAFKYIEDVPYYMNDLGVEEPCYIPTMLPLNLVQFSTHGEYTTGIGVGLSFTLPMFTLKSAVKFMKKLIKEGTCKKEDIPLVYKHISVPTTNKLFSIGADSINIVSAYNVSSNEKEVNITEFAPGLKIKSALNKLGVYIDKSKDNTDVLVKLDRGKKASDYDLDKILSAQTRFQMLFHNNEKIRLYSVAEIFLSVYNTFKEAVLVSLNKDKDKAEYLVDTYQKLQKIKKYLNPLNKDTAQKIITNESYEEKEVRRLLSYSIDTFCKADVLEVEAKKQLSDIVHNITNIDDFCLHLYEEAFN
jgi:DNA gyrase/topoisomerase IV subunit A